MDYYVYVHKKKTTGEVFYVGKGRKSRAHQRHSRSKFWHNVVQQHGIIVEIIARNLSEDVAYAKEIELISLYGRRDKCTGTLVNLTDGGEGGCGCVVTEEQRIAISNKVSGHGNPNADKRIWKFRNVVTNEEFNGTKFEMSVLHPDISMGQLFSKGTTKKWIVDGYSSEQAVLRALSPVRIVNSKPKNTNIYCWINLETGKLLLTTCRGLRKLFPEVNTKDIINQGGLTSKGWTTWENYKSYGYYYLINHKVGEQNGNADKTEYLFKRLSDGFEYKGTRFGIESEFKISVGDIFQSRGRVIASGWCLASDFNDAIKQSRVDYTVYYLTSINGDSFKGTRLDFYHKYGFKIHALFRKTNTAKSVKGWSLCPEKPE